MNKGGNLTRRHDAWWQYLLLLFSVHCSLFTVSCSQDIYEKGEGKYSLMRGDFVEAMSDANKQLVSMVTDDGEALPLLKPYSAKWIATSDSLYRCMLYYNKVENDNGSYAAEVISLGQVPCLRVKTLSEMEDEFRTDPLKLESSWLSKSGKYLNLRLQLKTGVTDDTAAIQKVGIVADTLIRYADNTSSLRLMLHHDQGNVPEYYSTTAYVSLPTDSLPADTVCLSINTYDGLVRKRFVLR